MERQGGTSTLQRERMALELCRGRVGHWHSVEGEGALVLCGKGNWSFSEVEVERGGGGTGAFQR